MLPIHEITVSDKLMQHGVSRIAIEGSTIVVMHNNMPIRFDIDRNKNWSKTIENFEKASKGIVIDQETKQAIIFCLSDNWMNLHNINCRGDNSETTNNSHASTVQPLNYNMVNQRENKEQSTTITNILTVSEAQRVHSGRISVVGRIVSISELYQLVKKAVWKCCACQDITEKNVTRITEPPSKPRQCSNCDNTYTDFEELHEYINAITIVIQDDVPEATLDGMSVVVFEKYTEEIHVGENVKIIGKVEEVQDKKSRKYHSILLTEKIEYEHRQKLV